MLAEGNAETPARAPCSFAKALAVSFASLASVLAVFAAPSVFAALAARLGAVNGVVLATALVASSWRTLRAARPRTGRG